LAYFVSLAAHGFSLFEAHKLNQ